MLQGILAATAVPWAAVALVAAAAVQGPPGVRTPPAPAPPNAKPPQEKPVAAGDEIPGAPIGEPLRPGVLPATATPAAREAWARLLAALQPKPDTATLGAISAFDLWIDTRVVTTTEGGGKQQNDVKVRYRYLEPGFVRTTMLDSRVESLRGPEGDWLLDPQKGDVVKLDGADFRQDRRELSQAVSTARNYLALAQPKGLRIASLELLAQPPAGLPAVPGGKDRKDTALSRAAELSWLALTSPDFQVVEPRRSKEPPMFRVQIGMDPETHRPLLATIWQDEQGAMVAETAVLVDLIGAKQFKVLDGFTVPGWFNVHDARLPSSPFAFQAEPRMSVFVKSGSTLRPKLSADDFRPKPPPK